MAFRVEAQRERGLALAPGNRTRTRRTARNRRNRGGGDDLRRFANIFGLRFMKLDRLLERLHFRGSFRFEFGFFFLVGAVDALGDLGLLIVHRRTAGRQPGVLRARMIDHVLAECVMSRTARRAGRLGRLEALAVPAEVLESVADLAETLRPHGRTSSTLAGEKAGGER